MALPDDGMVSLNDEYVSCSPHHKSVSVSTMASEEQLGTVAYSDGSGISSIIDTGNEESSSHVQAADGARKDNAVSSTDYVSPDVLRFVEWSMNIIKFE